MTRRGLKYVLIPSFALCAMLGVAQADTVVNVQDSTGPWNGWMNVSELDGTPLWGSGWGIADLNSAFDDGANALTLSPNTIGDPDPYWYIGGGGPGAPGNKIMEANLYVEEHGTLNDGGTVTFEGVILADTFTDAHVTRVFVSDFAPDYSSRVDSFFDVTGPGPFSVNLTTVNDPERHVQYGFQTTGVNVWVTDVEPFGSVVAGTIPEPATAGLLALGVLGIGLLRKRRS